MASSSVQCGSWGAVSNVFSAAFAGTCEKALSGTGEKAFAGTSEKAGIPRTPLKALCSRRSPAKKPGRNKAPLASCPTILLEMSPAIKFVTTVSDASGTPFKFSAATAQPPPPPPNSQRDAVKYLKSGLLSDVEFVVRPTRFAASRTMRAHKQFLAMRNEVFFAMFFGSQPVEEDSVLITDLHPRGFYGLLKYLYTNVSRPESFEEAMYTREAARKYLTPALALACSDYIAGHITTDRVCPLLDCLATKDADHVDKAAMKLLKSDAMSVLFSDSFLDARDSTVELILESIAGVPESCVMLAVKRWSEENLLKRSSAGENNMKLESVMRPFLPKLRFLALSAAEFVHGPASWNVLSETDGYAILRNIIERGSAPLPSWVCTIDKARS